MKILQLTLLSTLIFSQAVPALAFSKKRSESFCSAIIDYSLTQDQINKKIEDAGDLKGATCLATQWTPPQNTPILLYALNGGSSNGDSGGYGYATVATLEALVSAGADVKDALYLSLNQPDLAEFLLQHGAKPDSDTFDKEVSMYGTSASLPVLMDLFTAGVGQPDLILNKLNSSSDADWLAAEQAISEKYPNATLFDQTAAYGFINTNPVFAGKLAWMVAHGLRFDVVAPNQTQTAFDYSVAQVQSYYLKNLALIATTAGMTLTVADLAIAAANSEAVFNYVLANLPGGASLSGTNPTALMMALTRKFSTATINQLLAAKPNLSMEGTAEPTTPLAAAAATSTPEVINELIAAGASVTQISSINHQTALMAAVAANKETNALTLIPASQSVINQQDSLGHTALMLAAQLPSDALVGDLLAVKRVNVEAKDVRERTALFYAIDADSEASVLELLARGVCVHILDITGQTPLGLANDDNAAKYEDAGYQAIIKDIQAALNLPGHC